MDLNSSLLETGLLRGEMGLRKISGTSLEMFIRMVFSALTDADYLATEEHFDDRKTKEAGALSKSFYIGFVRNKRRSRKILRDGKGNSTRSATRFTSRV